MKTQTMLLCAATFAAILCAACNSGNNGQKESGISEIYHDNYYWQNDEKIPLEKIDGKYFLMFLTANEARFKAELAKVGAELLGWEDEMHGREKWGPGDYKTDAIEADPDKIKDALAFTFYWSPMYSVENPGGLAGDGGVIELGGSNVFYVQLKDGTNLSVLEKLARENSVEMLGPPEYGWYKLACTNASKGNAIEMANFFYDTGLFESISYSALSYGILN